MTSFLEVVKGIGAALGIAGLVIGCFWFFAYVGMPFLFKSSPESRLQAFIDKNCIEGNEVAIKIKRRGLYKYRDNEELIREAIKGNKFAYIALRLDDRDFSD